MKLIVSGEGPSDIGACSNAQGRCSDEDFSPGPMMIWLQRLWAALLNYELLTVPGSVVFVSETALKQASKQDAVRMQRLRSRSKAAETGFYFNNALQLGLKAKELQGTNRSAVMAVLFHDTDNTRSAPGQLWKTKWESMMHGFDAAGFAYGVPIVPKPISEAWLLACTKQGHHSHAALEEISGTEQSEHRAKALLDEAFGGRQSADQLAEWCADHPDEWGPLQTMPSFKAFFDRFHEVAELILRPAAAQLNQQP